MILLDVNVVLAAHRADHPQHATARPWFDALVGDDDAFAVPDPVWASFIRLATNRRIFIVPTPTTDAFAFVRSVRAQPNHVVLARDEANLEIFETLCLGADATGDLAADAYLAAIAIAHGCTLASFDRDFARFEDLTWIIPGVA